MCKKIFIPYTFIYLIGNKMSTINRLPTQQQHRHNKKTVKICSDTWLEVIHFLCVTKIGSEIALVNCRLNEIADLHLKRRTFTFGVLEIQRSTKRGGGGGCAQIVKYVNGMPKCFSLLRRPLPAIVVGFERITISYIDHSVLAFLRRIGRLFDHQKQQLNEPNNDNTIALILSILRTQNRAWQTVAQHICPLVLALPPEMLQFDEHDHAIDDGPSTSDSASDTVFVVDEEPTTSSAIAVDQRHDFIRSSLLSVDQMVCKWLHIAPRPAAAALVDGRPKVVEYCQLRKPAQIKNMVDQLKEIFCADSTPVNYIVIMHVHFTIVPFELSNKKTQEQLSTILFVDDDDTFLVERRPIVCDERQWAEWEMEAIRGNRNTMVQIAIGDDDIGSLSVHGESTKQNN